MELMALHAEFGPAGFQVFLLDTAGAQLAVDGVGKAMAFVVMTRRDGLLVAVPKLALEDEVLTRGTHANAQDMMGPSTRIDVDAGVLDEDALLQEPSIVPDKLVACVLVDFSSEVVRFMTAVAAKDDLEGVHTFSLEDPWLVPLPDSLVAAAMLWAGGAAETSDRLQFYSADEVPETPTTPVRQSRRRATPGSGGPRGSSAAAPKKRITVASLAESLDAISDALPAITQQLSDLSMRTAAIEAGVAEPPSRASALRKPLGGSTTAGLSSALNLGGLVKAMPPPKTQIKQPGKVTFTQDEAEEMEAELPEVAPDLARAVLEQSRALTALVNQIATSSSDPLQDLGSGPSALSSKGAAGRARLQAELAQHKGVFFQSVLQSMARRMQPAQTADVEMIALRDRGVTPTQYLERFGGYGRTRDLGFINWQVALCLNHMQEENFQAAKDALALLFVCLEQTAMDGGKMEVGLLLALVEDPPQSLFSGRSQALAANPRPFAPTANQRWVTTALQYLKEMDVITTRRAEVTSSKSSPSDAQGSNAPTSTPSSKKKGKGKGPKAKAAAQAAVEEEV